MTSRRVSEEHLRAAEMAPKRRHAALSVAKDGRPKLSGSVSRPAVWFEANHYGQDGTTGEAWRSDTDYTVTAVVDGVSSALVYVANGKVESVTFSMLLAPFQLDLAIAGLRRCGLGRLALPALRETQRQLRYYNRETPALRAYFRRVLGPRARSTDRGTRPARRRS